jgi:hypothetical protein
MVMQDELQTKRELNARLGSRDFFLEIVRDVSCDLDPESLVRKILINVVVLLSAERASLHFVEGTTSSSASNAAGAGQTSSWSTGGQLALDDGAGTRLHTGRGVGGALVSHSFDARDHVTVTSSEDRYTVVKEVHREGHHGPWGHGVIAYVAETGNAVNTINNQAAAAATSTSAASSQVIGVYHTRYFAIIHDFQLNYLNT